MVHVHEHRIHKIPVIHRIHRVPVIHQAHECWNDHTMEYPHPSLPSYVHHGCAPVQGHLAHYGNYGFNNIVFAGPHVSLKQK